MAKNIGILPDRLANRLVGIWPSPKVELKTPVPIISFTMDDVPVQAWENGARILEEEGVRGTFYISRGMPDQEARPQIGFDGVEDLHAKGHEVACHTFAHKKLVKYTGDELADDLTVNCKALDEAIGTAHRGRRNFAVPYGMATLKHQPLLRQRYRTSRSVIGGINRGRTDAHYLAAVELRPDPIMLDRADRYLDEVFAKPGWLIYFTHDVSQNPSFYGCHEDFFRSLIVRAKERGAKIMTVDEAADYFNLPK